MVGRERDDFERELTQLREQSNVLEREFSNVDREKKHFEQEVGQSLVFCRSIGCNSYINRRIT